MDKDLIDRLAVASVAKPSKDRFIGTEPHMGLYLDIGEYAIPIGDIMYSFAALLAEECAKVCENTEWLVEGSYEADGMRCASAIREKFKP